VLNYGTECSGIWSPQDADADLAADLATAHLTDCTGPQPRGGGHQRGNVTFKGIAGGLGGQR
jgi:hypothetical protein